MESTSDEPDFGQWAQSIASTPVCGSDHATCTDSSGTFCCPKYGNNNPCGNVTVLFRDYGFCIETCETDEISCAGTGGFGNVPPEKVICCDEACDHGSKGAPFCTSNDPPAVDCPAGAATVECKCATFDDGGSNVCEPGEKCVAGNTGYPNDKTCVPAACTDAPDTSSCQGTGTYSNVRCCHNPTTEKCDHDYDGMPRCMAL